MNLYDSLKDALYNSTKVFFPNNEVIHSHQGSPEPSASYCSVNILNVDRMGREHSSTYVPEVTQIVTSRLEYEATVRFMFVGKNAGNMVYHFESSIFNPVARFTFYDNNLSIMRTSEVRRIPEKRDTTWVDYFTFDVVFSYAVVNEQQTDIIEDVSWNENIIP